MTEGHEPAQARALLGLSRLADARRTGDRAGEATAGALFEEACAEMRRLEAAWRLALLLLLRAELELASGQLDAAEAHARQCEAAALNRRDAVQLRVKHCHLVLAEIELARGRRGPAREHLARALSAPGNLGARGRARISAALAGAGLPPGPPPPS